MVSKEETEQLRAMRKILYEQILIILKNDHINNELKAKAITDSILVQISSFFYTKAKMESGKNEN